MAQSQEVIGKANLVSKLAGKEYSPMILRKYTKWGFPIYVGVIADENLDQLDEVVDLGNTGYSRNSIQDFRNIAGSICERVSQAFNCEGVAVIVYADKMFVSSLWGDFMTHAMCRQELFFLLNMSTGV